MLNCTLDVTQMRKEEFSRTKNMSGSYSAAELANEQNLQVNAGHGLNYINTQRICGLPHLRELNIGHSVVSRAIFVGLTQAVQEMREIIILNS